MYKYSEMYEAMGLSSLILVRVAEMHMLASTLAIARARDGCTTR